MAIKAFRPNPQPGPLAERPAMTYPRSTYEPIPPLEGWELDELRDPDPEARELLAKTHPGFTIHCQRCGSNAVGVDSDVMMWSDTSGGAGGVFLHCAKCDLAVYLWEAAG